MKAIRLDVDADDLAYEVLRMSNDCEGICLNCGITQFGVEPDAEGYECENCLENAVYGISQAVLMGMIQ